MRNGLRGPIDVVVSSLAPSLYVQVLSRGPLRAFALSARSPHFAGVSYTISLRSVSGLLMIALRRPGGAS